MLERWRRWFGVKMRGGVSGAWIKEQAIRDGRAGWEGPRWWFPAERLRGDHLSAARPKRRLKVVGRR